MQASMSEQFDSKQVFASLGKSVTVLAMKRDGERYASAATAVCNIADNPASILVCLKSDSSFGQRLLTTDNQPAMFSVNVLGAEQQNLLNHLMTSGSEDRFSLGDWQLSSEEVPFLADAACSMQCQLIQHHQIDTHAVCIARIVAANQGPDAGTIIFHNNTFHKIGSTS